MSSSAPQNTMSMCVSLQSKRHTTDSCAGTWSSARRPRKWRSMSAPSARKYLSRCCFTSAGAINAFLFPPVSHIANMFAYFTLSKQQWSQLMSSELQTRSASDQCVPSSIQEPQSSCSRDSVKSKDGNSTRTPLCLHRCSLKFPQEWGLCCASI
jgi:hypothetical protein